MMRLRGWCELPAEGAAGWDGVCVCGGAECGDRSGAGEGAAEEGKVSVAACVDTRDPAMENERER